jgi:hypothetical protein
VPFFPGARDDHGSRACIGVPFSVDAGGGQGEIGDRGGGMLVGNGPFVVLPQLAHLPLDRGEQRHRGRQARVLGEGPDEPDGLVPAAGPDQFKDCAGL